MASRKSTQNSAASVIDGYDALDVIGSGTFGLIRKVCRRSDGRTFARKELNFERMSERDRKQIVAEVNILRNLAHDNVVKYEERYVDTENGILYIVMEYCEGGDLGSVIKRCRKTNTLLPEDLVWSYLTQMTMALDACHFRGMPQAVNGASSSCDRSSVRNGRDSCGTAVASSVQADSISATPSVAAILHRDLKPENVFLDGNNNIKLGDFGLSKQIAAQAFTNTYVGTPYYMSPELATGGQYDSKSDIWALGCITYELCALAPPFDANNQAELNRKIKAGNVPELPRGYSTELGAVIRSMLELNPRRRPTTRQLLQLQQIKFAARTLELGEMHRKLSAEKARIRAYSVELDRRESELGEREAAVAASENALGTNSLERLAEREAEVAEREARAVQQEQDLLRRETEVMKANADVEARRTDLQQKWEAWFHDQQTRAQVLSRARVSEGEGASTPSRIPRSSEARAAGGILRAGPAAGIASSKSSQGLAAVQGRGAIVAARPVGVRRVSGGKVRVSSGGSLADVDMSVNIRERVAAGATGLGTSRSVRERELRMHERTARCVAADGDGASLEMRNQGSTSEGSDEWVDNESAPTSDEQDAQDGFADHQGRNWNAVPNTRFSGASAERERNSRRSSAIFSVARRQLGTSRTAADDSDVAMRTADEDSSDKENVSSSFGVQSPNEVDSDPFGGSFEKLGLRRSSSAKQPSQSVAAAPTSGVITMAGRPQAARPALQTRTTAPAASGPNIDLNGPVYDLSRDDDLPSPFLKKMERMPNSAIPRSGSNTNFMARAAALAAARGAQAQATRASDAAPEQEREKEKEKLGERAAIRASRRLSAGPSVTSNQLTAQTAPKEGQQGRIVRRPRSSALPSFSVAPLASTAPRISSTAGLSRILPERA